MNAKKARKAEKHALLSNARPKDKYSWIYRSCLLFGCATLIAYSFIINAPDFLDHRVEMGNIIKGPLLLWVQAAYILCNVIVTCLVMLCGHLLSLKSQILFSLILVGIMMLSLPFLTSRSEIQDAKNYIILAIAGGVGCTTAIISCAFIGFCNHLPIKYLQIGITGQTLSGIIPGVLRIAFNYIFKTKQTLSDKVYFCICGVFCILCAILFLVVYNTQFIAYYLQHKVVESADDAAERNILSQQSQHHKISSIKSVRSRTVQSQGVKVKKRKKPKKNQRHKPNRNHQERIEITSTAKSTYIVNESSANNIVNESVETANDLISSFTTKDDQLQNNSIDEKNNDDEKQQSTQSTQTAHNSSAAGRDINIMSATYSGVLSKIYKLVVTQFLTFFVTFLLYPGMLGQFCTSKKNNVLYSSMSVFVFLEFNICDYIGRRYFASFTSWSFSKNNLWIACVWRIVMYPIFLLMYLEKINPNVYLIVVFTALLGITNGHFCCLCFLWAPSLVERDEQRICGNIMNWAVTMGILFGTYVALGIQQIYHAPKLYCAT